MIISRFIAFVFIILIACNPEKVDTRGVKEEMGRQKIKKITPGEIMAQAEQKGLSLIDSIQNDIHRRLDSALKSGSVKGAMTICKLSDNSLLKSLEKENDARIYRAGFPGRLRNSANTPDTLQAMVLDGYQYNMEKGLSPIKDVSLEEEEVIVNVPVFLDEITCLRCHGMPATEIGEKEYKEILDRYPKDKSTGFKLNDPMGVWTVRFQKDAFVRKMK